MKDAELVLLTTCADVTRLFRLRTALEEADIPFLVRGGQTVAVMGPTGAGELEVFVAPELRGRAEEIVLGLDGGAPQPLDESTGRVLLASLHAPRGLVGEGRWLYFADAFAPTERDVPGERPGEASLRCVIG